MGGIHSKVKVQ